HLPDGGGDSTRPGGEETVFSSVACFGMIAVSGPAGRRGFFAARTPPRAREDARWIAASSTAAWPSRELGGGGRPGHRPRRARGAGARRRRRRRLPPAGQRSV